MGKVASHGIQIIVREIDHSKGICPNAEFLQDKAFFALDYVCMILNLNDIKLI